jgi:hypothetical protein
MKIVPALAAATATAALLAGCGGHAKHAAVQPPKSGLGGSSAPTSAPPSPTHTGKAPPTRALTASGAPTNLDPCQLVTQQEASSLTHAAFGPGKEEGNGVRKDCVYGSETANVLSVYVVTAASESDAQAGWNQLLAEAQQAAGQAASQITLTPQSGIGDRAEWAELSLNQVQVQARGLAFQSGVTGVYIIDLVHGGTPPSRADLTAEAQTVVGRL